MEEFNKPWMARCNPDLILRFWRHKGSKGRLVILKYGVLMEFTMHPFGEVCRKLTSLSDISHYLAVDGFQRMADRIRRLIEKDFIYDPKPMTIEDFKVPDNKQS